MIEFETPNYCEEVVLGNTTYAVIYSAQCIYGLPGTCDWCDKEFKVVLVYFVKQVVKIFREENHKIISLHCPLGRVIARKLKVLVDTSVCGNCLDEECYGMIEECDQIILEEKDLPATHQIPYFSEN